MGFQERDLMKMTPAKFFALFDAWIELNDPKGKTKRSKRNSGAGLDIDGLP